jgi:hypothetical protein
MIRIALSPRACRAIKSTLPKGAVVLNGDRDRRGRYLLMLDNKAALHGPSTRRLAARVRPAFCTRQTATGIEARKRKPPRFRGSGSRHSGPWKNRFCDQQLAVYLPLKSRSTWQPGAFGPVQGPGAPHPPNGAVNNPITGPTMGTPVFQPLLL